MPSEVLLKSCLLTATTLWRMHHRWRQRNAYTFLFKKVILCLCQFVVLHCTMKWIKLLSQCCSINQSPVIIDCLPYLAQVYTMMATNHDGHIKGPWRPQSLIRINFKHGGRGSLDIINRMSYLLATVTCSRVFGGLTLWRTVTVPAESWRTNESTASSWTNG
jgi:hypothetical protein